MRSRSSSTPRPTRTSPATRFVRVACALGLASVMPVLVVACKPAPVAAVFDAGPPPAPTPTAPTVLVPMDEDAGSAPDANPPPVHHGAGGPALTTNQVRAKQCCAALKASAKTDPMLAAVAAQCETVAMQMGPTKGGQAPELAFLKTLPKLPALCQGL